MNIMQILTPSRRTSERLVIRWRFVWMGALLAALAILLASTGTQAQSGDGFAVVRWTVDGGGAVLSADGYVARGAVGQSDAHAALTGDGYVLQSGFWTGSSAPTGGADSFAIYLPIASR